MLQRVVTYRTGRTATHDYTTRVGKTATSSNYRDAWVMGFTGQYVAGVWLGNDDFSPMARVTGGSFPAQTWHDFMVLAHDTDNIPNIPGLTPHPVQVAEQQRLAQMQQAVATDSDAVIPAPTPESVKDMSSATRQILERIGDLLKDAPSLTPSESRAQAPAPPEASSQPSVASASGPPEAHLETLPNQAVVAPQQATSAAAPAPP
jgi:penicillin-binding protein 1A